MSQGRLALISAEGYDNEYNVARSKMTMADFDFKKFSHLSPTEQIEEWYTFHKKGLYEAPFPKI